MFVCMFGARFTAADICMVSLNYNYITCAALCITVSHHRSMHTVAENAINRQYYDLDSANFMDKSVVHHVCVYVYSIYIATPSYSCIF